ncbi:MAG: metallophosphoesterase [Enhydrobacter sp.]|nr:MAG: metallophosphoesterase [Enhydrobacter sp.]
MGSRIAWAVLSAVLLTFGGCTAPSPAGDDPPPVAWTQFGHGDDPELIARVLIGPDGSCPTITVDGITAPMRERADPRAAIFGRMCEERRPLGATMRLRIASGGHVLLDQSISRDPARIAVLGDTGCRVTYYKQQACTDPREWPFARIADAASARDPGLIVHVGDYYYREAPCLGDSKECAPGLYGDRGETWRAEFFAPARNLLPKAPWVFVRGNHEDCERGGFGWTYYFGDGPVACEVVHRRAIVRLTGLTLVNVDSSNADNAFPAVRSAVHGAWRALADDIARDAGSLLGPPASAVLVVTHDPAYSVCARRCSGEAVADSGGLRTIADRIRASGWRTVVLAGHIHAFQSVDVVPATLGGDRVVTQLTVGNSGTALDSFPLHLQPPGAAVVAFDDHRLEADRDGVWRPVARGRTTLRAQVWAKFGFGVLVPGPDASLTIHDPDGERQFACDVAREAPPGPRCR